MVPFGVGVWGFFVLFFCIDVQLCDCVLAGRQAGAVVEEGAAVARPFACLVNIATTAAR